MSSFVGIYDNPGVLDFRVIFNVLWEINLSPLTDCFLGGVEGDVFIYIFILLVYFNI